MFHFFLSSRCFPFCSGISLVAGLWTFLSFWICLIRSGLSLPTDDQSSIVCCAYQSWNMQECCVYLLNRICECWAPALGPTWVGRCNLALLGLLLEMCMQLFPSPCNFFATLTLKSVLFMSPPVKNGLSSCILFILRNTASWSNLHFI